MTALLTNKLETFFETQCRYIIYCYYWRYLSKFDTISDTAASMTGCCIACILDMRHCTVKLLLGA